MAPHETRPSTAVFHRTCEIFRNRVHVVLVRPENGGNVGSTARAMANMGIRGTWSIVGTPAIFDSQCRKLAKHASDRLHTAKFFDSLGAAFAEKPARSLTLAATARAGSTARPHPLPVRTAIERAVARLVAEDIEALFLVFGCESDGLSNEEIALCDWVVTIPSDPEYRSLNLAQSVLLFCYEVQSALLAEPPEAAVSEDRPGQRDRLVAHMLQLAEEVGFVLPGDPFKMRPRLEEIFSRLPKHVKDARTLHGLLDQIVRTVRKGEVTYKGRYKHYVPTEEDVPNQNLSRSEQ